MAALRKRSGFLGEGLGKFWRRRNTRGGGRLVPGDGAGRAQSAPAHSELSPEAPQSWVRQGSVSVVSDLPLPRTRRRWTAPRAGIQRGCWCDISSCLPVTVYHYFYHYCLSLLYFSTPLSQFWGHSHLSDKTLLIFLLTDCDCESKG